MLQEDLSTLTDEQLIKHAKLMKNTKTYDAVIIGFLVGVAIYSTVNNGFGLLTFLPLVYIPTAGRNNKKRAAVEALLRDRGLD